MSLTRARLRTTQALHRRCCLRNCASPSNGYISLYDLSDQLVEYRTAWKWQIEYAASLAREREHASGLLPALLLLQHEPTYTLGTGSSLDHLKFTPETTPHPLIRTERGGEVTFHGPGQLTIYPILDLKAHGQDLHKYLRALEQVIIDALAQEANIHSYRIEGLTGVMSRLILSNTASDPVWTRSTYMDPMPCHVELLIVHKRQAHMRLFSLSLNLPLRASVTGPCVQSMA
jgi:hypothetical protein